MINNRNEELLKSFGLRLRELRENKGMSQELLAYNADISISQVSRIERGLLNSTISTIVVLAQALEVESYELLKFTMPYKVN